MGLGEMGVGARRVEIVVARRRNAKKAVLRRIWCIFELWYGCRVWEGPKGTVCMQLLGKGSGGKGSGGKISGENVGGKCGGKIRETKKT